MKSIKLISMIIMLGVILASCNKEETKEETPVSVTFSYTSLSAEQSKIAIGGTTKVSVTATGTGLTYAWTASDGDIIGSGEQITYGASTCCSGDNTITCTVKDASDKQEVKTVSILVQ